MLILLYTSVGEEREVRASCCTLEAVWSGLAVYKLAIKLNYILLTF
jgi:hypothetical protein